MQEGNIRRLARMQFDVADKDKSGYLDEDEFLQVYDWLKEQAEPLRLKRK